MLQRLSLLTWGTTDTDRSKNEASVGAKLGQAEQDFPALPFSFHVAVLLLVIPLDFSLCFFDS